jgi:uncharacterized membrane protein
MWAAYIALVNQQLVANGEKTIGFLNPTIYAQNITSVYDTDFHDIASGTSGSYSATTGYDLVTGWGSPNAGLINALAPTSTSPTFTLSASPASVSVVQGNSGSSTITSTVVDGFSSAVALTASGLPTGVTATFSPTSITGSGTSSLTLAVASTTATGTYTITVTGTGGGITQTATVSLTVTSNVAAGFTLTASPTSLSVTQRTSGSVALTTAVSGSFDSAIALSASGEGSGVTVSFSKTSIAAPGSGTSTMTLKASRSATTGTFTVTVKATGGGITHTVPITLTIVK